MNAQTEEFVQFGEADTQRTSSRSGSACGVGFEGDWLPLAGATVAHAKTLLRDAGNIPYFADAWVNGRPVSVERVLRHGDRLGFSQRFGFKGADDRPAEAQTEALVNAYPELLVMAARVKALGLPADQSLDVMAAMVAMWLEERFGVLPKKLEAVLAEIVDEFFAEWSRRQQNPQAAPVTQAGRPAPRLTEAEQNILEAIGNTTLTGEKLADKAGYPCNSNFKNTLSSLVKRGLLINDRPGYRRP
jgi:hypothetical protein